MAYNTQNFQPLSIEQVSPFGYALQQGLQGIDQGVDLRKKIIENQISNYKKQYAPLTLQADAASKMAYANLMGPQFLAKILGNPDLLSNIPDDKKRDLLNLVTNAGSTSPLNNPNISSILSKNNPNIDTSMLSNADKSSISNMSPGDSYVVEGNGKQLPEIPFPKTFAENKGEYEGVAAEGKEAGKIRAQDIQDLGQQYDAGLKLTDKFNIFNNLINDPNFQSLRSTIPGFQGTQLKVLKNFGTPEQQELIGTFTNTANEVVRDTISSFPGQKLRGEVNISQNMKVNDNDTFGVMVGKVRSAEIYKELNMQRSKMTGDLMERYHMSRRKAENIANKELNAQGVINDINKKLDYSVQIRNKKTGKVESVPVSVARQRGVPGV